MFARIRQGIGPAFLVSKPPQHLHTRMVRFKMVMTLIVMLTCLVVQTLDQRTVQAAQSLPSYPSPVAVTQPVEAPIATTDAPATTTAASTVTAVLPPISPCQPTASVTQEPVNLGQYGDGLTIVRDGVRYYQVYGDDRSTVQRQIRQCGPQNEYAADSAYNLNWSYALRADDAGLCRVVGVKVGVPTSVVLPYRVASGDETANLLAQWQAFVAALSLHENGHTVLAEQHGARLLMQLQTYPAGDCYTMGPGVEAMAQGVAYELAAAQRNYDAANGHGETQGAVF